jgi:hypothetical protein
MRPSAVVEHFHVLDPISAGVLTGDILTMRRALALEPAKAPFRHGIVQALSLTTHPTAYAMRVQQAVVRVTGLLTASLRMMPQARRRLPSSPSQVPRLLHHDRIEATPHRPADPLA